MIPMDGNESAKTHDVTYGKRSKIYFDVKCGIFSAIVFCSLLAYSIYVTLLLYSNPQSRDAAPPPRTSYLPNDIEGLYDFVTSVKAFCNTPLIVDGSQYREGDNRSLSGHEGTYICLDDLPKTPDTCRIYSFGVNREDIKFEIEMGKRGCRTHIVTPLTEYSYSQLGVNTYLYPLHLMNATGLGSYTLDSFMNLLNHMWKPIHYVKTTLAGTEWTFLFNLFTSNYQAYFNVKQVRLLLHLPPATDGNLQQLVDMYRMLIGLEYYDFKLVYTRPIPDTQYYHAYFERYLYTKYETVWIRR
ncbi:methyltransferase-like protein 24 [Penaeus japonicus]|uniref:methyltransferase-like protein 24 n=1 Tax=Penaeus japonicus TaxID=27405 RepID=UPI001C71501B|nr:methyltransferase-like protein 24 [Penaeus japonicus]